MASAAEFAGGGRGGGVTCDASGRLGSKASKSSKTLHQEGKRRHTNTWDTGQIDRETERERETARGRERERDLQGRHATGYFKGHLKDASAAAGARPAGEVVKTSALGGQVHAGHSTCLDNGVCSNCEGHGGGVGREEGGGGDDGIRLGSRAQGKGVCGKGGVGGGCMCGGACVGGVSRSEGAGETGVLEAEIESLQKKLACRLCALQLVRAGLLPVASGRMH
jgi:hypothetical protein